MKGALAFDRIIQAAIGLPVVYVFLWLAVGSPQEFKDPLIALVSGVVSYWIGSSLGSKRKEEAKSEETSK